MTEATIGHNGGPALEEGSRKRKLTIRTQWAKALFADKRTPSYVIAMCWAIHWYSQDDGSGAALSNEQFETMCGVPDRSVTRGKRWLYDNGYVSLRVGRSGQKTRFQMLIPDPALAAVETQAEPEPVRQGGGIQDARVAALANSIRQGGGLEDEQPATEAALKNPIRHGGDVNPPEWRTVGRQGGDLIQESNQERKQEEEIGAHAPTTEEKTEQPSDRKSGNGFWHAAFAPKEADPHDDVLLHDGKVVLLNGAKTEWLLQFQGDEADLNLALIEISAEIQPNSNVPVKAQVSRKLAQMTRKRREQDKRYAAAAAAKGKPATRIEDAAARRERIRQHAIEAAEAFERQRGRQ